MKLFQSLAIFIFVTPIFARAGRKIQNNNPQNFQSLLTSIDEKLNKLDNLFITQNVEFDPNTKKFEVIEEKLSQIESMINAQGVKINENISQSHFKYDIDKDHFLRNVDLFYDRVNHKLAYLEMKIEMGEKKIFEKLEAMNVKFDKMLDNLTTREGDIEGEIVDILVAVDELKTNSESQNISKALNKTLDHIEKNITADIKKIKESLIKQETSFSKLDKNLYLHETKINQVARIINESRNEMQNGLRSLTVEVGRLSGKKLPILDDEKAENNEIKILSEKIDENFENIMLLQNLFLESCHRVQMDETQLESKISDVLQQLIDSFEKKSSMESKDLKTLEQLIKTHDATVRRNLHITSQNLISLSHNNKQNKDDMSLQMVEITQQMQLLYKEIGSFKGNSAGPDYNIISNKIKDLENYINITKEQISKNGFKTSALIQEIGNQLNVIKLNISNSLVIGSNHMTSINSYLKNISKNLNDVNDYFQSKPSNNSLIMEIENILKKHLMKNDNIDNVTEDRTLETIKNEVVTTEKEIIVNPESTTESLDDFIIKIFGKPSNNNSEATVMKLDLPLDVRGTFPKNCTLFKCDD